MQWKHFLENHYKEHLAIVGLYILSLTGVFNLFALLTHIPKTINWFFSDLVLFANGKSKYFSKIE